MCVGALQVRGLHQRVSADGEGVMDQNIELAACLGRYLFDRLRQAMFVEEICLDDGDVAALGCELVQLAGRRLGSDESEDMVGRVRGLLRAVSKVDGHAFAVATMPRGVPVPGRSRTVKGQYR